MSSSLTDPFPWSYYRYLFYHKKSSTLFALDFLLKLKSKLWNKRTAAAIILFSKECYPKVSDQDQHCVFICSTASGTAVIFFTLLILGSLYFAKTRCLALWNTSKLHWWLCTLSFQDKSRKLFLPWKNHLPLLTPHSEYWFILLSSFNSVFFGKNKNHSMAFCPVVISS